MTIDVLPDLPLLEIFDFCMDGGRSSEWQTLVHVCRRWRNIIFYSHYRLKLQLECIPRKSLMKTLDVWPPFPIIINGEYYSKSSEDNIMAMLKHNDRVCGINLRVLSSSLLENVVVAMQEPFPILTNLRLCFPEKTVSDIPADLDSFLGGFAPSLRSLSLEGIPLAGVPALLLTATHLVYLSLSNIPHCAYFLPIAMVTCLSMLTSLKTLLLLFESFLYESPGSRLDRDWRLPQARTGLPALTSFSFKGACEYLEDFVARIDAPRLDDLHITFFNQLTFDTPQLAQFISRTPTFKAHNEACVEFYNSSVSVTLPQADSHRLHLRVSCRPSDWQLWALTPICTSSFPRALIPMVERLYVFDSSFGLHRQDGIDNSQWLEFLRAFSGVKDIYLSWKFVPRIAPALQELVGDRVTEVFPALQSLFLEGLHPSVPVKEAIDKFTGARKLSECPIAVSHWDGAGHVL
jgi:hypothetical protein